MSQIIATEIDDFICNKCCCEQHRLIHNIWYGKKHQRLCTSCVLFTCKEFFCPTCFGVHGLISKGKLVHCKRCNSKSHPKCFPSKRKPPFCLSCIDPKRLIFNPKEVKSEIINGKFCRGMDANASVLFLTATQIGSILMCGLWDDKSYHGVVKALEIVGDRNKGKSGVKRAMKDHDLENKDRDLDSFLDFLNSVDEYDSSCETLSDCERMQKLRIEGEVSKDVRMEIDLNEECASKDDGWYSHY